VSVRDAQKMCAFYEILRSSDARVSCERGEVVMK